MAIYSIGEALIDFLPEGAGFIPVCGGAPFNVAASVAKTGGEAYFIGMVGEDLFGNKIISEAKRIGIKTDYITVTKYANTALAFVTLEENGERKFAFYRKPSADMFLDKSFIENIPFKKDDILHFCSIDLVDMPVKYATLSAIERCRKAVGVISFDPNVRLSLWDNHSEYKKVILEFLTKADIIKLSDDELPFLFEGLKEKDIVNELLKFSDTVIITRGSKGSSLYDKSGRFDQKPYDVVSIDTTGAGDSFIGTFLRYYKEVEVKESMKRASASSAIVCTKKGVIASLPAESELLEFMKKNS